VSKSGVQPKPEALEDYFKLNYPVTLFAEPEGGYSVIIPDLPGCMSQGETLQEAMDNIEEARQLWIETALEYGDPIPLPSPKSVWQHLEHS